jgi:predicted O-methyltransferase YrrM
MEIVNPLAQQYAESFTTPDDALLQEIADYTNQTHAKAHMLSGHLQGQFLQMVSCMIQPSYVLEIGTFTGYSAICLAKGLQPNGELHTIEVRQEDAVVADGFIKRSAFSQQIKIHIGDALPIVDELDYPWDLVFIDADKVSYTEYFNRVLPKVKPGGFILADNVLFHGQVLTAEIKGKNPKAIQAFNEYVMQRTDVEKVLLPLRDGIYLIRKL